MKVFLILISIISAILDVIFVCALCKTSAEADKSAEEIYKKLKEEKQDK